MVQREPPSSGECFLLQLLRLTKGRTRAEGGFERRILRPIKISFGIVREKKCSSGALLRYSGGWQVQCSQKSSPPPGVVGQGQVQKNRPGAISEGTNLAYSPGGGPTTTLVYFASKKGGHHTSNRPRSQGGASSGGANGRGANASGRASGTGGNGVGIVVTNWAKRTLPTPALPPIEAK